MNYHIITFGCQMNKADSERIASALEKKGYKPASKMNEADLIVVNMCSVRQSAVDRIYGLSQKLAEFKTQNPKLKTILTGCLLKEDRKKLAKKFDSILNNKEQYHRLVYGTKFIPISRGCNNFCSYCVVPYVRGPLKCRGHQDILKEVKKAIKEGFKEIWLLGQNVNNYQSPADSSVNFPKLLKKASELPGSFSIRFMSPNPKNFSNELIDVMAKSNKVAKFLNLPMQSGDNEILKKMGRFYTAEKYKSLVEKIKKKIPEINLSTDVIVGFPGETKKQFNNTAKLLKEIKFNIAYIAKYSPRPGTAAFKLKDNVSQKEKKRREKVLREILKNDS
ncbi:MAG: MiaB/RimO family radical SAM methylthiotransferase [bacterium]